MDQQSFVRFILDMQGKLKVPCSLVISRNYVTFDIIRRILSDYFGYNVIYAMSMSYINDMDEKVLVSLLEPVKWFQKL